MRNAGFLEFAAFGVKAESRVEGAGMHLRVEYGFSHAATLGFRQQRLQHGAPYPNPPIFAQHRHTPDMTVGQKTSGADDLAGSVESQRMARHRIQLVPLHFPWNALLHHEHGCPYRRRQRLCG